VFSSSTSLNTLIFRGGNRAGQVEFGFELDGSSSDSDFWKKSSRVWIGLGQDRIRSGRVNLHIVFFHIFDRF
jgi:hypothetical protein